MEQFSKTSHRGKAEEREFQIIGGLCEFDKNEDTLSVYFDYNCNTTSPKMVRNNILER